MLNKVAQLPVHCMYDVDDRQERSEMEAEKNLRIQPGFEPTTY